MNYNYILIGLQDTNPKIILKSLINLATYFDENEIDSEFVNSSFHYLLPHIVSNHYKIRSNSIIILTDILENYYNLLDDVSLCIPGIIYGLHSVNNIINEHCYLCIKQIVKNENPETYWEDYHNAILNDRSLEVRINLIKILQPVSNYIPLNSIVQLIDDHNIQIRNSATQILQSVDKSKLKETLKSANISYEGMTLLVQNIPEIGELDSIIDRYTDSPKVLYSQNKVKETIMEKNRQIRSTLSHSRKAHMNEHDNRTTQIGIKKPKQSNTKNENSDIKNKMINSNIDKSNEPINANNNEQKSSEKLTNSQPAKSKNAPNTCEKQDFNNNKNINASLINNQSKMDNINNQNVADHSIATKERTIEQATQRKQGNSSIKNNTKERDNLKTIGHITSKPAVTFEYDPHQLENLTWLERAAFLDSLSSNLSKNIQFTSSPIDLVDCVLTVSKPQHQKITIKIPPILAEILLRYPEVLKKRSFEITQFALLTMMNDEWKTTEGFRKFLSAVILQTDPQELIETTLKVSNESNKKLPFEQLIKSIYDYNSDLRLPYYIVSHFISATINQKSISESQKEILSFLVSREPEHAKQYCLQQSPEQRALFLSILPQNDIIFNQQTKLNKRKSFNIPDNEEAKIKIIDNEFKLGAKKGNLKKCILALLALNDEISMELFTQFVTFIGKFKLDIVNNIDELTELCCKKFNSSKYLQIFDAEWIPVEIISGISRIIWYSSESMLQNSDKYLPILYETFRGSSGRIRVELVKIFLCIEKVTGKSILDLKEVVDPYRQLLISLSSQFQIQ